MALSLSSMISRRGDGFDIAKVAEVVNAEENSPEALKGMKMENSIAHKGGFSEEEVRKIFADKAGLSEFSLRIVKKINASLLFQKTKKIEATVVERGHEQHDHSLMPAAFEAFLAKAIKLA